MNVRGTPPKAKGKAQQEAGEVAVARTRAAYGKL